MTELEKWAAVHSKAVLINEFEDWRQQRMAGYDHEPSLEYLIYEFFEINPKKLEAERRQLLDDYRAMNV